MGYQLRGICSAYAQSDLPRPVLTAVVFRVAVLFLLCTNANGREAGGVVRSLNTPRPVLGIPARTQLRTPRVGHHPPRRPSLEKIELGLAFGSGIIWTQASCLCLSCWPFVVFEMCDLLCCGLVIVIVRTRTK